MVGGRQGAPGFDASRLRAAREAAHLTQGALAEAAGAHLKEVREWESGRRVPQVNALAALARALNLGSPLDLLTRNPDQALTLQQMRTAAGLSQQLTAEAAGLLRTTYSQVERGETATLSADDAAAIGRALHEDPADVIAAHAASRSAHLERRPAGAARTRATRAGRIRPAGSGTED